MKYASMHNALDVAGCIQTCLSVHLHSVLYCTGNFIFLLQQMRSIIKLLFYREKAYKKKEEIDRSEQRGVAKEGKYYVLNPTISRMTMWYKDLG